ncbi:MAG: serine/threonine protein kinase [Deltaproteobacteria bacterium]|nr:serine/threonine protein kinase [Deltaproteobacteria bacterium]
MMMGAEHPPVSEMPIDRYVIVEYLAEGGMGTIYLGKKIGMGGFEKEVVLKQLLPEFTSQPEFIDLFFREAKLSASLDHANIVHTIDLVAAGSDYFIVMEYVRGGDLRTISRRVKLRRQTLSPAAVLLVGREILNALAYAHAKRDAEGVPLNLIHRDISPSNIMISMAGEAKLADFGIAKVSTHKSVFYQVKGKVGYMSPEQAYADRPIDHRSDLYSLAICIYELLSGERLFVADLMTTPEQIYAQPIPPLEGKPGMARGIDGVFMRALAVNPDHRYQTAAELQEALVGIIYDNGIMYTAPDLAKELIAKCGPDPLIWNIEDEEDLPDEGPGTAVLDEHEDEDELSGGLRELTSVLDPYASWHGELSDVRDPIKRQPSEKAPIAYAVTQLAPDFDLSDKDEVTEHWVAPPERHSFNKRQDLSALMRDAIETVDEVHEGAFPLEHDDKLSRGNAPALEHSQTNAVEPSSRPHRSAVSHLEPSAHTESGVEPYSPSIESIGSMAARRDVSQPYLGPTMPKATGPRHTGHKRVMLFAAIILLIFSASIVAVIGLSGPDLDAGTHATDARHEAESTQKVQDLLVLDTPAPDISRPDARVKRSAAPKPQSPGFAVKSTPSGAEVLLDGRSRCHTPCQIRNLKPRRVYLLAIRRRGYVEWSSLVQPRNKGNYPLEATLTRAKPPSQVGYLVLRTRHPANVAVDGRWVQHVTSRGRLALKPGKHMIQLHRPGARRKLKLQVRITRGQTTVVRRRY